MEHAENVINKKNKVYFKLLVHMKVKDSDVLV